MPKSLVAIEKAADLLEMACKDMKQDPFSQGGRDRLISGSRGILQGTTAMLVSFDESQVSLTRRLSLQQNPYASLLLFLQGAEDLP